MTATTHPTIMELTARLLLGAPLPGARIVIGVRFTVAVGPAAPTVNSLPNSSSPPGWLRDC